MNPKHILCFIALTFVASCTLDEPSLPSWDTQVTLDLPAQDYLMEELLDDPNLYGGQDSLGTPIIYFSQEHRYGFLNNP